MSVLTSLQGVRRAQQWGGGWQGGLTVHASCRLHGATLMLRRSSRPGQCSSSCCSPCCSPSSCYLPGAVLLQGCFLGVLGGPDGLLEG